MLTSKLDKVGGGKMKLNVERVEYLKKEKRWSQNEMARQLGLHESTLSSIMNGKRGIGTKTIARFFTLFPEETFETLFIRKE